MQADNKSSNSNTVSPNSKASAFFRVFRFLTIGSFAAIVLVFIFFSILASTHQSSEPGDESAAWIMMGAMVLAGYIGIAAFFFALVSIVLGHRSLPQKGKSKAIKLVPLYLLLALFSTPIIFLIPVVPNMIYNVFGKNIIDFTAYNSYSDVKKEIDSCNIEHADEMMINGVGGYEKGNIYLRVYKKNSLEEHMSLKINDRYRLYNDLKDSACNYEPNTYRFLVENFDGTPLDQL